MSNENTGALIDLVKSLVSTSAFAPKDCTCERCNGIREHRATIIVGEIQARYNLTPIETETTPGYADDCSKGIKPCEPGCSKFGKEAAK